jgi:hypothetical protein
MTETAATGSGIIGAVVEGLHKLEADIESILHPAPGGQSVAGETDAAPVVAAPSGISATTTVDAAGSASILGAVDSGNVSGGTQASSAPLSPADSGLMSVGISGPSQSALTSIATAAANNAATPSPSDALLTRWHREMSVIGRGLSSETEKLIEETRKYLGL